MKLQDRIAEVDRTIASARAEVARIESAIAEIDRQIPDLEREIKAEEERTSITDPGRSDYPLLAARARTRIENLQASRREFEGQLAGPKSRLEHAESQLVSLRNVERRREERQGATGSEHDH